MEKVTSCLKVKKLSSKAIMPTKGVGRSVGWDLYAARNIIIPAGKREIVWTDVAIQFPPGCYGRIADKSSVAYEQGLTVGGGVVDPDYTGNVGVLLFNMTLKDVTIEKGDQVAQIICEKYMDIDSVEEVTSIRPEPGDRGIRGFGMFL